MKKLVLQSLTIAAFNIALGGLVVLAFFSGIIWGKPVIALVFAVLALPGILLQPWFVIFCFMPGGLITAPVLTTVVSIPFYIVLDRVGKLDRAKHFLSRLNKRKAIGIIACIVLCMLAFVYTRYIDFPALRRSVPSTLEYYLKDLDIELQDSRYYCLGSFLDSEYLWQAKISERDMTLLAGKLSISDITLLEVGKEFWNKSPYWWKPDVSGQIRIMATPNFPMTARGQDGRYFLAAWDPDNEILHMWIKDNF